MVKIDDITRRRIDFGSKPDYGLLLDIKGYRTGNTGNVRWNIVPVEWTDNIDPDHKEYMAEILDRVVEVLRQ